mmetsp:Transcript_26675/g.67853  ORF Transcript_26675/g.67853 Transcript_26675/m.67853 type:complete len:95 (+) Transcript_26675:1321-1605(+)
MPCGSHAQVSVHVARQGARQARGLPGQKDADVHRRTTFRLPQARRGEKWRGLSVERRVDDMSLLAIDSLLPCVIHVLGRARRVHLQLRSKNYTL